MSQTHALRHVVVLAHHSASRLPVPLDDQATLLGIKLRKHPIELPAQNPQDSGAQGIIHLDSAWFLANEREKAFQILSEWVAGFTRHAIALPPSLQKLTVEQQDRLGKDLSMLASCRNENFLFIIPGEMKKGALLESLQLWSTPQVVIRLAQPPANEKAPEEFTPPDLVEWFVGK
jgi:hypothetical protein